MALTQITDLVARGRTRVLKQYVSLTTRFLPLIDVLTGQAQELEDAIWGYFAQLDLSIATDIWLDRLGWIVGEMREGETDAVYRRLIQARIMANKSDGSIEEILAVVLKVLGDPVGLVLTIRDTSPASIELILSGYVILHTDAAAARLQKRLQRLLVITRASGVRFMVIVEPLSESTQFAMSTTALLQLHVNGFGDAGTPGAASGHFRTAFVA